VPGHVQRFERWHRVRGRTEEDQFHRAVAG
jgi:hypothetical protein